MGEVLRATCTECGFEKQLMVGAGMASIRADVVEQKLKGAALLQWKELQTNGKIRCFSWEYKIGCCQECKEVQSCFVVNVHTNDDEKITLKCACEGCQGELELLADKEDMQCPDCGQKKFHIRIERMWD